MNRQLDAGTNGIVDQSGAIFVGHGDTVPPDGTDGYASGCLFVDTDSRNFYLNMGTRLACKFRLSTSAQIVDVRSYGATGDGVTDDGAAIQAAVNAASAAGQACYLPAGTYITTTTIVIPSNMEFFGAGPATIIKLSDLGEESLTGYAMPAIRSTATMYPLIVTDQDAATTGIYLHDFAIDGNSAAIQAEDYHVSFAGLILYNTSDSYVERVNIDECNKLISLVGYGEFRSFCLVVANSTNVRIRGGTLGNAGYESLGVRDGTRNIRVEDVSVIKDMTTDYGNHGCQCATMDPVTYPSSDITFMGCHFAGMNSQFITHSTPHVTLIGCSFRPQGATDNGMTIMDLASYVNVLGCRFYRNTAAAGTCKGIFLIGDADNYPTHVTIQGCSFDTWGYCVDVAAGDGIIIANNVMVSARRHCVEVENDAPADDLRDIRVIGNNLTVTLNYDAHAEAIEMNGVTRGVIRDNTLVLPVNTAAIRLDNSDYILVDGNDFTVSGTGVPILEANSPVYIATNSVGFADHASGTATVANGATSVDVTHGLGFTPVAKNIVLTPTNNLGNASHFWVSDLGATTFRVNVDADPGATTATFAWVARQVW